MAFRGVLLVLAVLSAGVLVPAASATDHTLSPGEGVRLPGTSLAVVNEGTDLFLGDIGCNGHVVTNRLWIRQNGTGILLADSPSGPLGKPPAAPHVFFPSNPTTGFLGPLPVPSSFDSPLQPGQDRVVFPAGGGNTIVAGGQSTPAATFFQTVEGAPNGFAVQGSFIGVLSTTDARIAQITSTGPSILFQANQPSSQPPDCPLVSKAETLVGKAARSATAVAAADHKIALQLAMRAFIRAISDEEADFEASVRKTNTALEMDDYKGAAGAASLLIGQEKKFEHLEVQIEIKIKNPQVKKEVVRNAHELELAIKSAAAALSALA
jgi:hypothetical protein